jgi:hypothetical protein
VKGFTQQHANIHGMPILSFMTVPTMQGVHQKAQQQAPHALFDAAPGENFPVLKFAPPSVEGFPKA